MTPGEQCAFVQLIDGAAELIGEHDEDERGRNDLGERSGGGNGAGGEAAVVTVAQHDGQRDQAHGNDGGGDNAGGGGEHRADENDGVGEAAADGAEQLADGFQQVLGHAGALKDQPHEGEKGDREQRVVAHHFVDAAGHGIEQRPGEGDDAVGVGGEFDADDEEHQPHRAEREGDRVAEQQERDERREHEGRKVLREEDGHDRSFPRSRYSLGNTAAVTASW